jgi:hypothetical protein
MLNILKFVCAFLTIAVNFCNAMDDSKIFLDAYKKNNWELVDSILKKNTSLVNLHDKNGTTPLMMSIASANKTATKKLLKRGASVNYRDKQGHTALDGIIGTHFDTETARRLISCGALTSKQIEIKEQKLFAISRARQNSLQYQGAWQGPDMLQDQTHKKMNNNWRTVATVGTAIGGVAAACLITSNINNVIPRVLSSSNLKKAAEFTVKSITYGSAIAAPIIVNQSKKCTIL